MGTGFLVQRGGSGGGSGGLELTVVGGTTRPAKPTQNMIWVDTDKDITSYVFSATQPDAPVEGMVWITISDSGKFKISSPVGKDWITVYPLNAKQYISGAWAAVTAMRYQNGEWSSLVTAPTDGLIAEYTFDEFSGNAITDTSLNGYNLTTTNVTQENGVVGKSAHFAGNGGAVANAKVIPDGMSGFSGLTVDFWLKVASAQNGVIMCQYNNYTGFYVGLTSSGELEVNYGGSSSIKLSDGRITDGQWHNICLVYNYTAGQLRMWIDGEKLSNSWSCSKFSNSNSNLRFGVTTDGMSWFLTGSLDQVRLYNRALSDDEVKTLWNGGSGC